jgi:hypothetical protein
MEATTQYFGKWFFYKQVLKFHCPSKFVCQTTGRQNHWSLLPMYSNVLLLSSLLPSPFFLFYFHSRFGLDFYEQQSWVQSQHPPDTVDCEGAPNEAV